MDKCGLLLLAKTIAGMPSLKANQSPLSSLALLTVIFTELENSQLINHSHWCKISSSISKIRKVV